MMEEAERLNACQAILTEGYLIYVNQRRRKVQDNEYARYLHVSVGSYNQWVNGNRLPSYSNCLIMAPNLDKLEPGLGERLFDALGYERVSVSNDPEIMFIAERWRKLDNEVRKQIIDHVREESESDKTNRSG